MGGPAESFVPRTIWQAKARGGAPVEIALAAKRSSSPRDIFNQPYKLCRFLPLTEVVDFVPYEETLKQLARERYKAYRVAGFNLNTATRK